MRKAFIVTTTALALSACVYMQHGSSFDIDAVNKLVPGVQPNRTQYSLLESLRQSTRGLMEQNYYNGYMCTALQSV
jgi:hypothetical protein